MKEKELYCSWCCKNRVHVYEGNGGHFLVWKCKHCGTKTSTSNDKAPPQFERNHTAGGGSQRKPYGRMLRKRGNQ